MVTFAHLESHPENWGTVDIPQPVEYEFAGYYPTAYVFIFWIYSNVFLAVVLTMMKSIMLTISGKEISYGEKENIKKFKISK